MRNMILEVFQVGMFGTNCYFYGDDDGTIALIDPGAKAKEILSNIKNNNYSPIGIIITHNHPDHTGAVKELKKVLNIPVFMSHLAKPRQFSVDRPVKEKDEIQIGRKKLVVFETPGHSSEGIILVSHEDRLIFSGDTIFNLSIGRTDFGGDYKQLMRSIGLKIMKNPEIQDDYKR
jgi:hydroxyacylglutathione hydrolase